MNRKSRQNKIVDLDHIQSNENDNDNQNSFGADSVSGNNFDFFIPEDITVLDPNFGEDDSEFGGMRGSDASEEIKGNGHNMVHIRMPQIQAVPR